MRERFLPVGVLLGWRGVALELLWYFYNIPVVFLGSTRTINSGEFTGGQRQDVKTHIHIYIRTYMQTKDMMLLDAVIFPSGHCRDCQLCMQPTLTYVSAVARITFAQIAYASVLRGTALSTSRFQSFGIPGMEYRWKNAWL